MEDTAALVACSNSKRDSRNPGWSLYDSVGFEKSWTAAMVIGHPYVMSAKHGLVDPTERLDPYDKTLKDYTWAEKVAWAEDVLAALDDGYQTIVLFGGRDYVEPIKHVAEEYTIEDPYEGTSGNGTQMSIAGDIAAEELPQ